MTLLWLFLSRPLQTQVEACSKLLTADPVAEVIFTGVRYRTDTTREGSYPCSIGNAAEKETPHMKRMTFTIAGSLMLLLFSAGFAVAKDRTFNGEIMDSACAKLGSHDGMMKSHADIKDAKGCTLGCVKGGAKFVLYDAASKMVYELDDQQKPMQFAGEKVKVIGTVDKATNTIHVTDIQGAS
jgi:hypothetical protein